MAKAKPAPVLETSRLTLRNWTDADIAPFMAALNTPNVMRWLGGVQSEEMFRAAYDRIQGYASNYGHTFWIVERKSDGALLGFCGLKRVNADGTELKGEFEIGWRLREDAWGQGYAREAATESLRAAFEDYGATFVVALTVAGNEGSWRLMQRLGMKRRHDLDFTDPRYGPELNPVIIYAIDKNIWACDSAAQTIGTHISA